MPSVRADLIDVYIVRPVAPNARTGGARSGERGGAAFEFLQLRRTREPMAGTWHCVMGHVESGEAAVAAMVREVLEEVGLDVRASAREFGGVWCLEQVHPFFVPELDAVVLSPRFVVEVPSDWEPRLNAEHDGARWVDGPIGLEGKARAAALRRWLWPGQRKAVEEACAEILALPGGDRSTADRLRLDPSRVGTG